MKKKKLLVITTNYMYKRYLLVCKKKILQTKKQPIN